MWRGARPGRCRAPGRRWLDLSAPATRLLPEDEVAAIAYFTANGEKGTDVNLATRLLVDGFGRRYESAAVISNDGDLKLPALVISPTGARLVKPAGW